MSIELFDLIIQQIDNGLLDISEFEEENLFMNIFYRFNFIKFLSPYINWGDKFIFKLKCNIRKKWSNDLPNVNYFIRLLEKQSQEINPSGYYFNSEDYFTKLLFLKPIADVLYLTEKVKMIKKRRRRRRIKKKYCLIR